MTPRIAALAEKIRILESELGAELAKRRAELRIGLEHGRVAFETELLRRHRALRRRLLPYLLGARPLVVLTAPVIYAGIVPFLLLARWRSSTAPIAPMPTASSPIHARSRRAPSNTGVRSSTRGRFHSRTRAIPGFSPTATRTVIAHGCPLCAMR